MESESRNRTFNRIYKAFTVAMLVVGSIYLNHIQFTVNSINADRAHNQFMIEKLESKIKVLETKIDTMFSLHPWKKGSKK